MRTNNRRADKFRQTHNILWMVAIFGIALPVNAMVLENRVDDVVTVTIDACPTNYPTSTTPSTATSSPTSPVIKSPCDNNPSADGSVIQLYDSSGAAITGYSYTLSCNTWFEAEAIKEIEVPDLYTCLQSCHEYNQADDLTGPLCYSVGIIKSPGGLCYLKGVPQFGSITEDLPHDSAVWIAD